MINSDISVVLKPQIYSIFDIYKKVSNFKKSSFFKDFIKKNINIKFQPKNLFLKNMHSFYNNH